MNDASEKGSRDEQLRAEVEAMAAALRERFGDEHPLLTPGLFRGSLWFQAAAWDLSACE